MVRFNDSIYQQYEALQHKNKALQAVYYVGRHLAQSLDVGEICWVIYREIAQKLWQAPHLSIALYNSETNEISAGFLIADGEEVDPSDVPVMKLGEGPVSDTIRSRQARFFDLNSNSEVKRLRSIGRLIHIGDERQPRSALYVPMISNDEVVGVMGVQHYDEDAFADTDLELLQILANQAGAALVNAQLFAQVQQQLAEMKKTQKALQESERRYRTLVEALPGGLVVVDGTGRISFANGRFCEMTGYSQEELLGSIPSETLVRPEDKGFLQQQTMRRSKGEVDFYELPLIHKDGRLIWTAIQATPLYDNQGEVIGNISVHININDKKKTEAALAETEGFLKTILASVDEGIVVTDKKLTIRYWNQYMTQLTGIPWEQVINKPVLEICDIIYQNQPDEINVSLQAGIVTQIPQIQYDFPGGQKGWLTVTHSPRMDQDGSMTGLVISFKDITRRVEAETAMLQAQKTESLGVLAGGVAHDFNNLLVPMLGQAQLAKAKLEDDHPAKQHVEKAVMAAERASEVTSQLLTYAGKHPFVPQVVDLNELILDNLHLFQVAVPENIAFYHELAEDLPAIEADHGQLQQVLMNLILNGVEAIGDAAGSVAVRTKLVRDTAVSGPEWFRGGSSLLMGQYIMLEVTDSGSGMDAETMSRIFDPFFTTKYTGRGLGLAAVQGIIRNHKGGIFVRSKPGQGTTFAILLPPAKEQALANKPKSEKTGQPLTGKTVLVIDDEIAVCEAVKDILSLISVRVLTADSGLTGIHLYREHQNEIDLILLDMSMPGMTGGETLAALKSINANAKVIVSSGYSQKHVEAQLEPSYVTAYMQKPYDLTRLTETVQKYL
jgi:PAS domain S-box-containing protein